MVQRGRRPRLLLEPLQALGIGGQLLPKHFDRHLPPELHVFGLVDLAHAAGPQERHDLERAELGAGSQGHGSS